MKNKNNDQIIEMYDFERGNQDVFSRKFKKFIIKAANQVINPSYKYLEILKKILNLPNDLDNDINRKKSFISILDEGNDNYKNDIFIFIL